MPKNKCRLLAIDPGTREMGVALLENKELVYSGVKAFKKTGTPHERLKEGRQAIIQLIDDLKPDTLVVEKTFFAQNKNCALLNVFAEEILALGKRKTLKVASIAPSTVKKAICGNGWASKKEVAKVIVSRYPRLKVFLTQDRAWKERYHQNMFDAVALGMTFLHDKTNG